LESVSTSVAWALASGLAWESESVSGLAWESASVSGLAWVSESVLTSVAWVSA
jgi:hypothetical protein